MERIIGLNVPISLPFLPQSQTSNPKFEKWMRLNGIVKSFASISQSALVYVHMIELGTTAQYWRALGSVYSIFFYSCDGSMSPIIDCV